MVCSCHGLPGQTMGLWEGGPKMQESAMQTVRLFTVWLTTDAHKIPFAP